MPPPGAAIAWQDIIDLEKEIAVDNADMGSLAFLTKPESPRATEKHPCWDGSADDMVGKWKFPDGLSRLCDHPGSQLTGSRQIHGLFRRDLR